MLRYIKRRVNNGEGGCGEFSSVEGSSLPTSSASTAAGGRQEPSGGADTNRNLSRNVSNKISRQIGNLAASAVEALSEKQRHLDETVLSQKVHYLANFDACVEACDALAASSSLYANVSSRHDPKTNLLDCSVLVSPDGDLLLMPQTTQESQTSFPAASAEDIRQSLEEDSSAHSTPALTELGEDYESAIYVGNDLDPQGDRALNGFSANGWSIPAMSLTLRQTEQSLHDFADFCEELVLSKKESASRNRVACDKLRAASYERGPIYPDDLREDAELMKTNVPFEINKHRVGPMLFNGGSLHAAHVALEEFYTKMADSDVNRWRLASLQRKGALPPLRKAATKAEERSSNRQKTLREMYVRVKRMEDHLQECKREAHMRWEAVEAADQKVTKLVEGRMIERSQMREDQRLKEFHQVGEQQGATGNSANTAEIWDIINQVTDSYSMENGSFEPISFPAPATLAIGSPEATGNDTPPAQTSPPVAELEESFPVDSRMDIEDEVGLPALRAAAFAADRAVQVASGSLLNVLSSLDQVRRSARISAEANLLSGCNAQADCIRSIVRLERAAAEERLREIQELEKFIDKINVRKDLDKYINEDRQRPGGSAPLGQDDDGGIASALAVLTSHVEGDMGTDTPSTLYNSASDDGANENFAEKVSPEALIEAIDVLFTENDMLQPDAPETEERQQVCESFNAAVKLLCDVGKEKSHAARPRRSRMCYSLNAKRNSNTEIKTPMQFDALCEVFLSILSGCDCESGGVANAKMCMMLSQSFYLPEKYTGDEDERSKRIYVKNRLIGHLLWSYEEFWDQVLFQCLSESLTNSGVMSNFERINSNLSSTNSSEWIEPRKMQWYDLSPIERFEAASQVHAVVFAQLGALAHSMIEFGCGLERSCAFVRRMAIRNQLPLSQRSILLQHLVERKIDNDSETQSMPLVDDGGKKEVEVTKDDRLGSDQKPLVDNGNKKEVEVTNNDRQGSGQKPPDLDLSETTGTKQPPFTSEEAGSDGNHTLPKDQSTPPAKNSYDSDGNILYDL